jgi:hypothetical protein
MKPSNIRANDGSEYGSVPVAITNNNAESTSSRRLISSSVNHHHHAHAGKGESSHLIPIETDDSSHHRRRSLALQYDVLRTQDSMDYSEGVSGDDDGHIINAHIHDSHHHNMIGQATIPAEVATIAKNLIGGGILSLSKGMCVCKDVCMYVTLKVKATKWEKNTIHS